MPKAATFAILTRLAELAWRTCVALSASVSLRLCVRVCILRILCTKLRSINFNRISSNWRESSNRACQFHRQHQHQQASALTQSRISVMEWSITYSTLLLLCFCHTRCWCGARVVEKNRHLIYFAVCIQILGCTFSLDVAAWRVGVANARIHLYKQNVHMLVYRYASVIWRDVWLDYGPRVVTLLFIIIVTICIAFFWSHEFIINCAILWLQATISHWFEFKWV